MSLGVLSLCEKKGCNKPKAKGQKYCSKSCAPYGRLGNDTPIASETTARSTSIVSGADSTAFRSAEQRKPLSTEETSKIPQSAKSGELTKEIVTTEAQSSLEAEKESSMPSRPPSDLVNPSLSLSEARLTSMNLIDDATMQLREQMRTVAADDCIPETVMASVECAKQIHNLIRLKLDIVKEARRSP